MACRSSADHLFELSTTEGLKIVPVSDARTALNVEASYGSIPDAYRRSVLATSRTLAGPGPLSYPPGRRALCSSHPGPDHEFWNSMVGVYQLSM